MSKKNISKTFQADVLEMLRAGGADVSKPQNFVFFLHLSTKLKASKAAAKMRRGGFSVEQVSLPAYKLPWLCRAKKTFVPDQADFADYNQFFKQVAADLNGVYKGWETEIIAELGP